MRRISSQKSVHALERTRNLNRRVLIVIRSSPRGSSCAGVGRYASAGSVNPQIVDFVAEKCSNRYPAGER